MQNETTPKDQILAFLESHELGALATTSPEGEAHVRLVYYANDPVGNLYFLSLANTRKVADIRANTKAAFVVVSDDKEHTLQIEGNFEEITDTATFGPIIVTPVTHLDPSKPVCFKLTPSWIRWGDFTKGRGNENVFTEIDSLV
jgi:hypothetical protein